MIYLYKLLIACCFLALTACQLQSKDKSTDSVKINGISLVSPPSEIPRSGVASTSEVKANWVSIIPYAFSSGHTPKVHFDTDRQWWGERPEGTKKLIEYAQSLGLKIMLKPHVWVIGDGWTGDFVLKEDEEWKIWEEAYTEYIITYAKIAKTYNVEILCIGTEFRQVVKNRPRFWTSLIKSVREVYDGKITYAANWDNFQHVDFWNELDYIGIDSYFPLSSNKTPEFLTLMEAWKPLKDSLAQLSAQYNRPILFTEYGYKSCDFAAAGHWVTDDKEEIYNATAQKNAYKALFATFWSEDWYAGGFLWKWFPYADNSLNGKNTAFTPQGKPVIELIRDRYSDF